MDILDTRSLSQHRHLNLFDTSYRDRTGAERSWVFASRCDPPKLVTGAFQQPDAVVIAALHTARKALVVIEEFRVPLGGYQYGFPAGLVDAGESVETAAQRELFEETGLELIRLLETSPPVYSSSGMTDESVCMVFCECDGIPTNAGNTASEDIRVRFISQPEARTLCAAPDVKMDAKAWIVLYGFARTGSIGG